MLFLAQHITIIQQSIAHCIFYWEKFIGEPISEAPEVKQSARFLWACEKEEEKMLREKKPKNSAGKIHDKQLKEELWDNGVVISV